MCALHTEASVRAEAFAADLEALRVETEGAIARAVENEQKESGRLLAAAKEAVAAAEERLATMSARRRDLCNRLQEANGAIRVLCRCRPLSKWEEATGEPPAVTTPSHNAVAVSAPMPPAGDGSRCEIAFDASFGVLASQQALYEEISPAVASVLSGQYVCVMAYGQTGAGKTYTMQGSGSQAGVVHLAVDELLSEARALTEERGRRGDKLEVEFEASLLEIYNEKVLDLMGKPADQVGLTGGGGGGGSSSSSSSASLHPAPPEPLEVRSGSDGSVSVSKLRAVPVASAEEVGALLLDAGKRRHTHGTLMNASSSRSHLVLTIYATVRSSADGSEHKGKLHLVDLAGSERVGKSGVVGEQMKEAQHINKSLSCLEQVMLALQNRQADAGRPSKAGGSETHIPYRNSKLTLLLSDALGAKVYPALAKALWACLRTVSSLSESLTPTSPPR